MTTAVSLLPALAYYVDSFDPVLFHVWGSLSVRWYGVAYVCGFVLGYLVWRKAVKDRLVALEREDVETLLTWAIAGVLVGGRLGYMLLYDFGGFVKNPLSIVRVDQGGMSFHGGMLGVVIAMAIVARVKKLSFWQIGDLCAVAAPFGLLLGRLANFVNGELWGRLTTKPWAVIFPNAPYLPTEATVYYETPFASGLANPRHPSQLYEAILEGVVLGALMLGLYFAKKGLLARKAPGLAGGVFLVFYAFSRIFCERFREPDASLFFGLTRGTLYSLVMAAAGALVVLIVTKKALSHMKKEETKPAPAFHADKSRFDKGAANWDENAERKARSNALAEEYGRIIDTLEAKPDLFDYGCGTGQSILPVASKCASVTGGDFSQGMLAKFLENAKAARLNNVKSLACDLAASPVPDARFDMLTCSMTMHHIEDTAGLLAKFAALLKSGGHVALADLETEDGSFHGDEGGVAHKGFDKEAFAKLLSGAGFVDIEVKTIYRMKKEAAGREYPLFLATARKP